MRQWDCVGLLQAAGPLSDCAVIVVLLHLSSRYLISHEANSWMLGIFCGNTLVWGYLMTDPGYDYTRSFKKYEGTSTNDVPNHPGIFTTYFDKPGFKVFGKRYLASRKAVHKTLWDCRAGGERSISFERDLISQATYVPCIPRTIRYFLTVPFGRVEFLGSTQR
jgi:hypothetical protein